MPSLSLASILLSSFVLLHTPYLSARYSAGAPALLSGILSSALCFQLHINCNPAFLVREAPLALLLSGTLSFAFLLLLHINCIPAFLVREAPLAFPTFLPYFVKTLTGSFP